MNVIELLKDSNCHITTGTNAKTGEPFLFIRSPGCGGVLHQSCDNGHSAIGYFYSEEGELEDTCTALGAGFNKMVRFVLAGFKLPLDDDLDVEKIIAELDELRITKTEVI